MPRAKGPWRSLAEGLFLAATLLLVPITASQAQDQSTAASRACRRQCETQMPAQATQSQAQRALQICLIRCTAGEQHLSRQNRAGTAEATGRGRPPGGGPQANTPPAARRSMVAYVGNPPGSGLTISRRGDHTVVHRTAQRDCSRANADRPCRMLLETMERCIAVAQGIRPLGMVVTRNPNTYTVVHLGVGSGPTLASAEQGARQDCATKLAPGLQCQMAARRCG